MTTESHVESRFKDAERMVPDVAYKYRHMDSPGLRELFSQHRIWLSSRSEFNDPFDCMPRLRVPTREELRAFAGGRMATWCREEGESYEETRAHVLRSRSDEKWLNRLLTEALDSVGIYSMSATPTSMLAWSHYANGHRGFCVALSTSEFARPSEGIAVLPVEYHTHRPEAVPISVSQDQEGGVRDHFLVKSTEWRDEREIRALSLRHREYTTVGKDLVRRVILGARMGPDDCRRLFRLLERRQGRPPRVKRAQLSPNDFSLDIVDLPHDEIKEYASPQFADRLARR